MHCLLYLLDVPHITWDIVAFYSFTIVSFYKQSLQLSEQHLFLLKLLSSIPTHHRNCIYGTVKHFQDLTITYDHQTKGIIKSQNASNQWQRSAFWHNFRTNKAILVVNLINRTLHMKLNYADFNSSTSCMIQVMNAQVTVMFL